MPLTKYQEDERIRWLDSLRAMIEYAEAHPEMPAPACWDMASFFPKTREEMAEVARYHAPVEKVFSGPLEDDWFYIRKKIGGIQLRFNMRRGEVCTKVPTGVKKLTVPAEPAKPAREIEIEQYEWRCDAILAPSGEDATPVPAEHAI